MVTPFAVKIPGTRFIVELSHDINNSIVRLVVDGSIEDQIVLDKMSRRAVEESILEILDDIPIELNSIQKQKIVEDMIKQTGHLFGLSQIQEKKKAKPIAPSPKPVFKAQASVLDEYKAHLRALEQTTSVQQPMPQGSQSPKPNLTTKPSTIDEDLFKILQDLDNRVSNLERVTSQLLEITDILIETLNKVEGIDV